MKKKTYETNNISDIQLPVQVTELPVLEAKLDYLLSYRELIMRYECALKEIRTKFEVLSTEYGIRYARNPISSISTRIKSTASIIEKMKRKGIATSLENMVSRIQDIAGVRVVCSYIDDIYALAEAFKRQNDVTVLCEKDYISSPKPNGYRSLHLIVSVPVFFADRVCDMTVEVQIRTIAMDFWASLEHELKYKQKLENAEQIAERLKVCADTIARTDMEMQNIRSEIEANSSEPNERDRFIKKLQSIEPSIRSV